MAPGKPLVSLSPFPRGQYGTLWGARELTRTSEFTRHVSAYKITGHLDLMGELMWRGQVKTQVGTTGIGDPAKTAP